MKRWIILSLISLTTLTGCQSATEIESTNESVQSAKVSPEPVQRLTTETGVEAVAKTIDGYLQTKAFNGTALVAKGDTILLQKGYGWSNLEDATPMSLDTQFQIASVSKSFVAVSILQLVEAGKLSLDQSLATIFPDMPNGEVITIHHLLTHTSQLSAPGALNGSSHQTTVDELIAPAFRPNNLKGEVGGAYGSYSNLGYDLLGAVVEEITGMSYRDYLKTYILDPLGMKDTALNDLGEPVERLATSYGGDIQDGIKTNYFHPSFGYSSGGIHSTVEDLYKYDRALAHHTLISQESYELMSQTHSYIGSKGYGYGWYTNVWIDNIISHPGNLYGWHSMLLRHNEDKVTVILLTNHDASDMNMSYDIANLVLSNLVE